MTASLTPRYRDDPAFARPAQRRSTPRRSSTTSRPAASVLPSPIRRHPAAGASGPTSRPRSSPASRTGRRVDWTAGPLTFRDRASVPPRDDLAGGPWRIVPGGTAIRRGAYLGTGVVVMPPSYVNVGAWVGDGTMVDSHVLVGSCAQIGARVHLGAGVTIGGVLEPPGARPVIVEDDAFVGAGSALLEGVLVGRGRRHRCRRDADRDVAALRPRPRAGSSQGTHRIAARRAGRGGRRARCAARPAGLRRRSRPVGERSLCSSRTGTPATPPGSRSRRPSDELIRCHRRPAERDADATATAGRDAADRRPATRSCAAGRFGGHRAGRAGRRATARRSTSTTSTSSTARSRRCRPSCRPSSSSRTRSRPTRPSPSSPTSGRLGLGADVASGGELATVRRAGIGPERVVMTGPGKRDDELIAAVAAGIRAVTVESPGELARLEAIARRAGRRPAGPAARRGHRGRPARARPARR